jgi:hypothetical protein
MFHAQSGAKPETLGNTPNGEPVDATGRVLKYVQAMVAVSCFARSRCGGSCDRVKRSWVAHLPFANCFKIIDKVQLTFEQSLIFYTKLLLLFLRRFC